MNTLTLYFTNIKVIILFPNIQKKQKLQRQLINEEQNKSSLIKFIKSISIRNKNTAKQYHLRLLLFEKFVEEKYNNTINVDELIQKFKSKEYDPYDILNDYCIFLQNNYNIGPITFRDKIITVKTFLEYNDIEISPKKFKLKVRFPKTVLKYKEAIDKTEIIRILNGCSDLRLLYWT